VTDLIGWRDMTTRLVQAPKTKVGAEPKAKSGSRAERPRWVDYEDFEEDVDDIGDGDFENEISHRPSRRLSAS